MELDLRKFILNSTKPLVIRNSLNHWDPLTWTLSDWLNRFCNDEDNGLPFRSNQKMCSKEPQWESTCDSRRLTAEQFIIQSGNTDSAEWLYFDYKDCATWMKTVELEVPWSRLGFPEQTVMDTTVWIGSKGASTPCHADTYGCNLVAQVIGRKQWILFPPSDLGIGATQTRVPYEESSIYSSVNFQCGKQILDSMKVHSSKAHVITLEPGDVLYVPHRWWHYVEHLSTAVSINTWMKLNDINNFYSYLDEFLVQHVVRKFTCSDNSDLREYHKQMLNPNEWSLLEKQDEDATYRTLNEILSRNAQYFLPGLQQSSNQPTEKSPISDLSSEASSEYKSESAVTSKCLASRATSSSSSDCAETVDVEADSCLKISDQTLLATKDPSYVTSKSVDSVVLRVTTSSTVKTISTVTSCSTEEFVEFCRRKCSCFRESNEIKVIELRGCNGKNNQSKSISNKLNLNQSESTTKLTDIFSSNETTSSRKFQYQSTSINNELNLNQSESSTKLTDICSSNGKTSSRKFQNQSTSISNELNLNRSESSIDTADFSNEGKLSAEFPCHNPTQIPSKVHEEFSKESKHSCKRKLKAGECDGKKFCENICESSRVNRVNRKSSTTQSEINDDLSENPFSKDVLSEDRFSCEAPFPKKTLSEDPFLSETPFPTNVLSEDQDLFLSKTPLAQNALSAESFLSKTSSAKDVLSEEPFTSETPFSEDNSSGPFSEDKKKYFPYPDYLLKAFTHSEVIRLVREKLLEEIRNGKSVYNKAKK